MLRFISPVELVSVSEYVDALHVPDEIMPEAPAVARLSRLVALRLAAPLRENEPSSRSVSVRATLPEVLPVPEENPPSYVPATDDPALKPPTGTKLPMSQ